ncbi:hypothetical protein GC173_17935 [bacterium]|nr:hypothetical protein [bacterium]
MSKLPKAPIEYGPDADDDDESGIEASAVQKAFVPFYAILFVMFLAIASVPVIFVYTIIWMNVDARTQMEDIQKHR